MERSRTSEARAVLAFAVSGLLVLVLIGVAGVIVLRSIGADQATREAERLVEVTAHGVVEPRLTDGILRGDADSLIAIEHVGERSGRSRADHHRCVDPLDGRSCGVRRRLRPSSVNGLRGCRTPRRSPCRRRSPRRTGRRCGSRRSCSPTRSRRPPVGCGRRSCRCSRSRSWCSPPCRSRSHPASLARCADRRTNASDCSGMRSMRPSSSAAGSRPTSTTDRCSSSPGSRCRSRPRPTSWRVSDPAASEALGDAAARTRQGMRSLRSAVMGISPPDLRRAGLPAALADLTAPLVAEGLRRRGARPRRDGPPAGCRGAAVPRLSRGHPQRGVPCTSAPRPRDGDAGRSPRGPGGARRRRGLRRRRRSATSTNGHLGLRLLGELVADAGGTLDVTSAPGDGTVLRVEVPVP